ncbi:uncharacterized protein [Eurosta solidaginis]|uniref:uncharacterized protein n=1 Tax=Eurosta solidaginis TaxID=178769 RepID=UPI00353170EE
MKRWAVEQNSPLSKIASLLHTMRKIGYDGLPLCAKTLLGTNRDKVELDVLGEGTFMYIGIENNLCRRDFDFLQSSNNVTLDVGIDGLQLTRSSKTCLWPILGALVDHPKVGPFLIACFQGNSKPPNPDDFLMSFCNEVTNLRENGIKVGSNEVIKQFRVRSFTCDSPARAFVTGVMSHSAKNACPKCICTSEKHSFPVSVGIAQTDESFKNRQDISHHRLEYKNKETVLESANFGMVSQFPLDPMHLVDLGVMKKLLNLLISKSNLSVMNKKLQFLSKFVPSEFSRVARDFNELSNWKSTEFRPFLLYTGIFVLKGCSSEDRYYHFLLLHTGIRLLCIERSNNIGINIADQILQEFVKLFSTLYINERINFNLHGILHIADCVRQFGPLDNFSAKSWV